MAGWTKIPNWVIHCGLKPAVLGYYVCLLSYARDGKTWVSDLTISANLNISERSCRTYRNQLIDLGIIHETFESQMERIVTFFSPNFPEQVGKSMEKAWKKLGKTGVVFFRHSNTSKLNNINKKNDDDGTEKSAPSSNSDELKKKGDGEENGPVTVKEFLQTKNGSEPTTDDWVLYFKRMALKNAGMAKVDVLNIPEGNLDLVTDIISDLEIGTIKTMGGAVMILTGKNQAWLENYRRKNGKV